VQLTAVDDQPQLGLFARVADVVDLADLDAAIFHLVAAVHLQPGPRRGQSDGVGWGKCCGIGEVGKHHKRPQQRGQQRRCQPDVSALRPGACHCPPYPERLKLPDAP